MSRPENNGNNASDFYSVKQAEGSDGYGNAPELDSSWRAKQSSVSMSDAAADTYDREQAETRKAIEARRRIMEIMEEDEAPLRQPQQQAPVQGHLRRKQQPQMSMDDLMDGMPGEPPVTASMDYLLEGLSADDLAAMGGGLNDVVGEVSKDLFHDGYMGGDNEAAQMAESMAGRPQVPAEPTWDWATVKAVATLKGGKKVPVWMVENKATGMQMQKPFRVQAPAERIASVLNVTGNVNDPRVRQIHEDYDAYVNLTKQGRKYKQLMESGDQGARTSMRRIRAELNGIKQRLGIENIQHSCTRVSVIESRN